MDSVKFIYAWIALCGIVFLVACILLDTTSVVIGAGIAYAGFRGLEWLLHR